MYYLVNLIKFKNHWKILEKWEKILEKSGKSQGILSVRKSGNPDWNAFLFHYKFCSIKNTAILILVLIQAGQKEDSL